MCGKPIEGSPTKKAWDQTPKIQEEEAPVEPNECQDFNTVPCCNFSQDYLRVIGSSYEWPLAGIGCIIDEIIDQNGKLIDISLVRSSSEIPNDFLIVKDNSSTFDKTNLFTTSSSKYSSYMFIMFTCPFMIAENFIMLTKGQAKLSGNYYDKANNCFGTFSKDLKSEQNSPEYSAFLAFSRQMLGTGIDLLSLLGSEYTSLLICAKLNQSPLSKEPILIAEESSTGPDIFFKPLLRLIEKKLPWSPKTKELLDCSLRSYVSYLYLSPSVKISVQGVPVEYALIEEVIPKQPKFIKTKETSGFVDEIVFSKIEDETVLNQGTLVYYDQRLIYRMETGKFGQLFHVLKNQEENKKAFELHGYVNLKKKPTNLALLNIHFFRNVFFSSFLNFFVF